MKPGLNFLKNQRMNDFSKHAVVLFVFIACALICTSVKAKSFNLKYHADIISLLAEIKSNSESINAEIKGWKGGNANADVAEAKELYRVFKTKDDALIERYKVIIQDWRKAAKENINIDKEMSELQKSYNNLVDFYNKNYKKYNDNPRFSVSTELVNIVFETGKKVWDFVKDVNQTKKNMWKEQTDKQKVKAWSV
ncbi:hypothetical protein E5K00_08315 [Hymenobacter aquaticus]|uniref:Uncharacterized protein n=1 Tax=Hymenobacter aquaticus TaxID=1867101 RepID=A0A4Z0Q6W4_9BACT|nr:hypothetical protein [Hymenobacter aquaticus]TGE25186.1 hypothetical protein E5K00_08315 [Hymenobacter aquaticus]